MILQRVKAVPLFPGAESGRIAAEEAAPHWLAEADAGDAEAFRRQNVKVKKASQRVVFLKKKHGLLEAARRCPLHTCKGFGAGGRQMAPLRENNPSIAGYEPLRGRHSFPENATCGNIVF